MGMFRMSLAFRWCWLVLSAWCLVTGVDSKLRKKDSLEARVQRLTELNRQEAVVRLKGDRFSRLVQASPRNYSVIIMLTASGSNRQCPMCKEAEAEYRVLADSWRKSPQLSPRIFFTLADVDEAPEVFQQLRLDYAPVFVHYPASGRPQRADRMELNRFGFAAEQQARFIAERTAILIPVVRPPNYRARLALGALVCVVGALLYAMRNCLAFVFDPTGWAVSFLLMIMAMTSGQMWNFIQRPPAMHRDPKTGNTMYIYRDYQAQFVYETYIIVAIQMAVVVGFILLNEAASLKRNHRIKAAVALTGLGMVVAFFGLLVYVFKLKHYGYPFGLVDVFHRDFWQAIVTS